MMDVYTLVFDRAGDWLAQTRGQDRRVEVVSTTLEAISTLGERPLILLGAGTFHVHSEVSRDRIAAKMLSLSRRTDTAILFGIDLSPGDSWTPIDGPIETFIYSCDAGTKLTWPHVAASTGIPGAGRILTIDELRIGVVVGRELFQAPTRNSLTRVPLDLAVVMSHGPVTPRWHPSLAALDRCLPTLVLAAEVIPDFVPRGWRRATIGQAPDLQMARFRRMAAGPAQGVEEHTLPM